MWLRLRDGLLARVIPEEVKALGNRFLPWPENEISLRPRSEPPKGLRLSEGCGSCCILNFFLDRKSFINAGIEWSGHMYADLFVETLLRPVCPVEVEKEYKWLPEHGTSGMDAVVDPCEDGLTAPGDSAYIGHYEFKSTSSDANPKPSKDNREQVIRQRVVMARNYGISDAELFNSYIFLISKSGKKTNWVYGPFLITPTAEELKIAQDDIDLRAMVYNDIIEDGIHPQDHPLLKSLRRGTCTTCFPLERSLDEGRLSKILGGRLEYDRWTKAENDARWQKKVKEKLKPEIEPGNQIETDYFVVRHTESGRLYVDPKTL